MLEPLKQKIEKAISHLELEYHKLHLGRANPVIIEGIMVDSYGSKQPIKWLASASTLDSQTLSIQPWDRSMIWAIAKAISDGGLWLNPQTMADSVIIKFPSLTEERRKEMVKYAKWLAEDARVGIRNARQDLLKDIKNKEHDKEISEDESRDFQTDLQKEVDEANKKVDEVNKKKEEEIMKV